MILSDNPEFDIAVVGLGYVGLPLVVAAAQAGLTVAGLDLDSAVVADLNAGKSHIIDIEDADVQSAVAQGFVASSEFSVVADSAATVICVPTPLDDSGGPDLTAVLGAADSIALHLAPESLVVLESTTYPGTTDEVLRPRLEVSGLKAGTDFNLAFSPERIDPGNPTYGIANTPKVVGGFTPECTDAAVGLYRKFVDEVVVTKSTREAETAKLLENTYRHINIALVNEMAVFCHDLGIDLWDAIRAADTKPFGFQAFWPGPGVGGHCIPIDPNYLSYKVRTLGYPFRFVELAQEISERMPAYVVSRAQSLLNELAMPVRGTKIALLGVTYKANVPDERESPSIPIAERLDALGADLVYCDPFIDEWTINDKRIERVALQHAIEHADLILLLQNHKHFVDESDLVTSSTPVLDTRGVLAGPGVETL